jgi:endonuclease G
VEVVWSGSLNMEFCLLLLLNTHKMPGLGPSLVFATGLAVGVGAGSFIPKKSKSEVGVLPPPPVEKYDVVKRLPTATGSVVLQGGFPGTFPSLCA